MTYTNPPPPPPLFNVGGFCPQIPPFQNVVPSRTGKETKIGHFFYKTRMCHKFIEGTCQIGAHCTFAHGPDELRQPPPNWQEIVDEQERKKGLDTWNDDRNIIRRMSICRDFFNGVPCTYGEKCCFLHEHPSKFKVNDISMIRKSDQMGENAANTHRKKRCQFAHGVLELQQPAAGGGESIGVEAMVHEIPTQTEEVVEGWQARWLKKKKLRKINGIYGDWIDGMESPPRVV